MDNTATTATPQDESTAVQSPIQQSNDQPQSQEKTIEQSQQLQTPPPQQQQQPEQLQQPEQQQMEPQQLQTTEQQMQHPELPEQPLEHQQEQQPEQQLEHQPEQQQPEQQQEQTHFQLTQLQHHQLQHSQQQQQFQQQAFQQSPQHFQPLQPAPPPQQQQQQQDDCSILSPTLADILSEDRILRFYQCVKDIKTQDSPKQTAAMFFALCHALGDTVSFLKVPNMSKIMFRQEQQIFAVNVAGTQQETVQIYQNPDPQQQQQQQEASLHAASNNVLDPYKGIAAAAAAAAAAANTAAGLMHDVDSTHSSNLFAATAADGSPQHLLQAALASVTSQVTGHPQTLPSQPPTTAAATNTTTTPAASKRRGNNENKNGTTTKRSKKASPRDKEYAVRRNEIIQDLLKVSEADLLHQANIVDSEVKLIIQGHERTTKFGMLAPLHRFAAFANLPAHYDCDFAPKNAGVYYNYEYFQLYLAYRDLEAERQQQQQMEGGDPRSILSQCRADIEKVLVSTNWEAIRRRLTIGERICQVCGIVGRGFLLLSKQVSGRKLLHNFNTGEWGEFMREFEKQENQPLLQTLQTKYNPERFYGPRQEIMVVPATTTATNPTELHLSAENIVKNETIDTNTPPVSHSESSTTATPTINEDTTTPTTATATATTPTTTNTAALN